MTGQSAPLSKHCRSAAKLAGQVDTGYPAAKWMGEGPGSASQATAGVEDIGGRGKPSLPADAAAFWMVSPPLW